MRAPTDVEVSRALNALATTLADQRPSTFVAARCQAIVDGALAGERKLEVHRDGPASGFVARAADGLRIADVALVDGVWRVERKVTAADSAWALPAGG